MSKKDKKQKKQRTQYKLDYISSIFLCSFLFAIAYDLLQKNKGHGYFTTNMIFGVLLLVICCIIMYRAIKEMVLKRKAQLYAELERREREAEQAENLKNSDDVPENQKFDSDSESTDEPADN